MPRVSFVRKRPNRADERIRGEMPFVDLRSDASTPQQGPDDEECPTCISSTMMFPSLIVISSVVTVLGYRSTSPGFGPPVLSEFLCEASGLERSQTQPREDK
ncbi:unnamed protein product [Timema podura]|uniref:Uncharacterized protein n=1 Tax=Timema podura TaxID=61482 RepID=A0ABN7PFR3_TIMPD|nr:unnamed protein product [Timema podura]